MRHKMIWESLASQVQTVDWELLDRSRCWMLEPERQIEGKPYSYQLTDVMKINSSKPRSSLLSHLTKQVSERESGRIWKSLWVRDQRGSNYITSTESLWIAEPSNTRFETSSSITSDASAGGPPKPSESLTTAKEIFTMIEQSAS